MVSMKGRNVFEVAENLRGPWQWETLALVNDTVIRVVLYEGEYPEHTHDADQWLLVMEGEVHVDVEGEEVRLRRGDTYVIPRGRRHRVSAPVRSVVVTAWREGVSTLLE